MFQGEYENLLKAREHAAKPYTFVLGGLKIDDYYTLLEQYLQNGKVDCVLATGALGELCLMAKGIQLGAKEAFYQKKGLLDGVPKLRQLLRNYGDKFQLPMDVAIDVHGKRKEIGVDELPTEYMIFDIGSITMQRFARIITSSKSVYVKGPAGAYEQDNFRAGSEFEVKACQEAKKLGAFVLAGGGNTTDMFVMLTPTDPEHGATYLLLSGGAGVKFMAGEDLPGILALEDNYAKFKL